MSHWYRTRLWPDDTFDITEVLEAEKGPSIIGCIAVGDSPDRRKSVDLCFRAVGRKAP